jgi:hypothetical protein
VRLYGSIVAPEDKKHPPENKYQYAWALLDENDQILVMSAYTPRTTPSWSKTWQAMSHVCTKVAIYRKDFGGSCSTIAGEFTAAELAKVSYAYCVYPHEKTGNTVQINSGLTVHLLTNELVNFFRDGAIIIENEPT